MERSRKVLAMDNNRILLVSPVRPVLVYKGRPHLGLGLLAKKLQDAGFEIKILDYIVDRNLPSLTEVIDSFDPGTAGITINTSFWDEADSMLDELTRYPRIKKLVGGPHATLYYDEVRNDLRINYIFRGESEESIVEVCRNPELSDMPVIIEPSRPEMDQIPFPAFECCLSPDHIVEYPLKTSRGCPFGCIFCEISTISSKKWRSRPLDCVSEELEIVKTKYPSVKVIVIQDDNPAHDVRRFKDFLERYIHISGNWELRLDNIRADKIDAEVLELLLRARCRFISIGVEHGNPEMFKSVNKGETLDQIREASRLIKKSGIELWMSFVIGLPGDSFEKTKDSVRFAKETRADYLLWHILAPHRGTKVWNWFQEHGLIRDDRNLASHVDNIENQIFCDDPICDCDAFPSEEIVRSHFFAVLATNSYQLKKRNMKYIIKTAIRYRFIKELIISLLIQFWRKNIHK